MGGVDLADMLIALYQTTYKSRRWYTAIFVQMLDICVNNAWLVYRRDCKRRAVKHMSLKSFRCQLARELQNKGRSQKSVNNNYRTDDSVRYDGIGHCPRFGESYGRCKLCIKNKTDVYCVRCNQRFCLIRKRNCFYNYHTTKWKFLTMSTDCIIIIMIKTVTFTVTVHCILSIIKKNNCYISFRLDWLYYWANVE